jgi:acyl carrier protein
MNDDELKAALLALLKSIAPEIEEGELRPDRALRNQVDLDSMDWLKFLTAVHERFKVDIPEADYARLVNLNDIVAYVQHRKKD